MLQLLPIRWDGPLHKSSDLLCSCLHAAPLNDKAEERDTVSVELALLSFNNQPVFQKSCQDLLHMTHMFLHVSGEDQIVIYVHKHKPAEEISKDVLHQGLKHSLGICESEGHDQLVKMS